MAVTVTCHAFWKCFPKFLNNISILHFVYWEIESSEEDYTFLWGRWKRVKFLHNISSPFSIKFCHFQGYDKRRRWIETKNYEFGVKKLLFPILIFMRHFASNRKFCFISVLNLFTAKRSYTNMLAETWNSIWDTQTVWKSSFFDQNWWTSLIKSFLSVEKRPVTNR